MSARSRLTAAARKLVGRDGRDHPPCTRAEADALRADLDQRIDALSAELAHLTKVVAALQEQLDRWTDGTSTITDGLAERLRALEAAASDRAQTT